MTGASTWELPISSSPNPMVRAFGPDHQRRDCSACARLIRTGRSGRYFKCTRRTMTSGAATDHRAGWEACALIEPRTPPEGPA